MRSMTMRVGVLIGAIALWCGAWILVRAQTRLPTENELMAPLLAQAEGQSTCFTGTFTSQTMDIEDWSRTRSDPTGTFSPDGKPYMRPVPPVLKDKLIRSFTLQLTYDSRTADYDWIYNFRLLADAEGIGTMYAAGECPWYAKDKVYGWDKREITGSTTSLGCYIDCDGGGFGLDRIAGAPALVMSFDPLIGLRMKGGCGGRGIHRIKPASADVAFRLQQTSAEACRPLEEQAAR